MIYELVNPSDPYTFEAASDQVAAAVAILLGRGMYDAKRPDGSSVGAFVRFAKDVERAVKDALATEDPQGFLDAHATELAAAFRSFVIGNREDYMLAVSGRTAEETERIKAEWRDRKRSSMNDIGKAADQYADHYESLAKQETTNGPAEMA